MRRSIRMIALALVALAAPVAAHAQDVSIDVQGVAPGVPVEIYMSGAAADRTVRDSSGSIASDFMSAGKPVDIFIDRCDDLVSVSVIEDGGLPPPEEPDCDRRVIENTPWTAGTRLVIDVARGIVLNSPTVGTQPDVQAAAQNVFGALKSEPASAASTAVASAVAELSTMPDEGLGAWILRFRDGYKAMGSQDAGNGTFDAMLQLLTEVERRHRRLAEASNAGAQMAYSLPEVRDFRVWASWNDRGEVFQNLRGRLHPAGAPSTINFYKHQWYFSPSMERYQGVSDDPDDPDANPVPFVIHDPDWDDFIEVTEITTARNSSPGSFIPFDVHDASRAERRHLVAAIHQLLPRFIRNGLRFHLEPKPRPWPFLQTSPAAGRNGSSGPRIGSEQGQISLATAPPVPQQGQNINRLPQLWLAMRSVIDVFRHSLVRGWAAPAFEGPGVRLMLRPDGRREYVIEPARAQGASAQPASGPPRPSLKVFIRSLGRSTGDNAQQAIVINDGNVPVRMLEGDAFATEPIEGVSEQAFAKELEKYAGRPRMTMNLTSYCLNFEKAAPTRGRLYRLAPREAQQHLEPVRRILRAAEAVRDAGELNPDGDPNLYFHSVRQWAIWTEEQRFNERTFADALLEYTKKNVAAGGRRWTREIEAAARAIIPNRWRDVQRVLAVARQ